MPSIAEGTLHPNGRAQAPQSSSIVLGGSFLEAEHV